MKNLKGITLSQLTIFQTIVQTGSIRGAARKLELTPPSVSNSLKQLESTLGLPLFLRDSRKLELTEAGHLLSERSSGALTALDYAIESIKDLGEQPSGKVSITLPRFVYQSFFRKIYPEFCQRYPEVQLEVHISDATLDIVKDGHDIGIRFGDKVEQGMVARQLTTPTQEALFASPDYIAEYGTPRTPTELQEHRLIQYRFQGSNKTMAMKLKQGEQDIAVAMPVSLIVNDTDAMVDAAENGLGIGRIIAPLVREQLSNGKLIPILEEHWQPYPGFYLYFPQHSQKARRIRVLVDFLVEKSERLEI
ncbi:LysR family transcriptional regulator [Vibrio maerlii]|uniref:LysR family transcriptional regulator n=1 Tax=Vibrio maerlii TaxID=2231648 RepID=UPI000E3C2513|nr:LysR family transcriptional regulator [Vibrio maerlii]